MSKMKTIVSGMRPTGKLHLGHYFGVISNWLLLQKNYSCFFFVADWHALTTEYANVSFIRDSTTEMVIDWLASGIDPGKVTLFVQSDVPEHAELHVLFSMITPVSWLERVPSFKEMQTELSGKDLSTYGFLGYPLLQTADIAIYKADFVPVGADQVPHLELGREVIRRFHFLYKKEILPEPQPLLAPDPKILGSDGRKMSKSYNNCLYLSETSDEMNAKIKGYYTDPARKRRQDPGNPDVCPIYAFHKQVSPEGVVAQVNADCKTAKIGCVDCKKMMMENLNTHLDPFRQKRKELESQKSFVEDVVNEGAKKAVLMARKTLAEVKEVMGLR